MKVYIYVAPLIPIRFTPGKGPRYLLNKKLWLPQVQSEPLRKGVNKILPVFCTFLPDLDNAQYKKCQRNFIGWGKLLKDSSVKFVPYLRGVTKFLFHFIHIPTFIVRFG